MLAQRLPAGWTLEIVVADGMSDDGTREALDELAARDPADARSSTTRADRLDGLNRALAAADAARSWCGWTCTPSTRPTTSPSAWRRCSATGADNVGGPWRAVADPAGAARPRRRRRRRSSRAGWPAARSRAGSTTTARSTRVYLGAWPRRTFERFGGFDESLVRNQDDEHNLRIVKGGGRVWQESRIRSGYRPRATLGQVFRQYLQYGYWKPFVMKKHGQPARLRQLVPALFVAALALFALMAVVGWRLWPLALLLVAYAARRRRDDRGGAARRAAAVGGGAARAGGDRRPTTSPTASARSSAPSTRSAHGRGRERFAKLSR